MTTFLDPFVFVAVRLEYIITFLLIFILCLTFLFRSVSFRFCLVAFLFRLPPYPFGRGGSESSRVYFEQEKLMKFLTVGLSAALRLGTIDDAKDVIITGFIL